MPKNKYKVSKRQWNKWSLLARDVFNYMYSTVRANQTLFLRPHQAKVSKRLWNTTAWNVAWIAANAVDGV